MGGSLFGTYLQMGFEHITDLAGYDHILFIVAFCAVYQIQEWRKVALLVTAFTVGHSITLAIAGLDLVHFPQAWVEFLIPVSIFLTALVNVLSKESVQQSRWTYGIVLLFGLIHGMGFSNFFRSVLFPGEESQLVLQLLAFNIGVELGQLVIVAIILLIAYIAMERLKVEQREWNLFISGMAASPALIMAIERFPY